MSKELKSVVIMQHNIKGKSHKNLHWCLSHHSAYLVETLHYAWLLKEIKEKSFHRIISFHRRISCIIEREREREREREIDSYQHFGRILYLKTFRIPSMFTWRVKYKRKISTKKNLLRSFHYCSEIIMYDRLFWQKYFALYL